MCFHLTIPRSLLLLTVFAGFAMPDGAVSEEESLDFTAKPVSGVLLKPVSGVFRPLSTEPGSAGVFVGVNDFPGDKEVLSLRYAVNDAIEQAYLFVVELKLIPAVNCRLVLSGQPTPAIAPLLHELKAHDVKILPADRSSIQDAVTNAAKLANSNKDVLIVSLASHGFSEARNAYILPSDGVKHRLGKSAVSVPDVEGRMEKSRAGHRLLLIDACQERLVGDGRRSVTGPPQPLKMSEAFQEALKSPTGQAKLASCSVDEFSYEDLDLNVGHGVFTRGFLAAMRGGARHDGKGVVRLGEVAEYVNAAVTEWIREQDRRNTDRESRRQQSPSLSGPLDARNMPLAVSADLSGLIAMLKERNGAHANPLPGARLRQVEQLLQTMGPWSGSHYRVLVGCRRFVDGEISMPDLRVHLDHHFGRSPPPLTRRENELTNFMDMKFRRIPAGRFRMGSTATAADLVAQFGGQEDHYADEFPRHEVEIRPAFYLGIHEVTRNQFAQFVAATGYRTEAELDSKGGYGWDPTTRRSVGRGTQFSWKQSGVPGDGDHPVVNVSYDDAQAFCDWLSELERRVYRLPREAEWEYACRAGVYNHFHTGNEVGSLAKFAQLPLSSAATAKLPGSQRVGSLRENGFGIHDLHGNVAEWCLDWYEKDAYTRPGRPVLNPAGTSSGYRRVLRGGSWNKSATFARSSCRSNSDPTECRFDVGFRVLLEDSE